MTIDRRCRQITYSSWTLPKLQKIAFSGLVPTPFHGSSITELSMEFCHSHHDEFTRLLHAFHSFIRATPTIEKLRVSFCLWALFGSYLSTFPKLNMENVNTIDFQCKYEPATPHKSEEENDSICQLQLFMQSLHAPNLQRLKILVTREERFVKAKHYFDGMSDLVFGFVPAPFEHSPVRNLEVHVTGPTSKPPDCCTRFITIPFDRFPALRQLYLRIDGQLGRPCILPDGRTAAYPALERLELLECWGGTLPFLREIVEGLARKLKDEPRLKVIVKDCPYVMKEDLLEFVGMRNLGFQESLLSDEFREHLEKIGIHPRPSEVPGLLWSASDHDDYAL